MANSLPLLYLDTSIPSAYYNDGDRQRQLITQQVWNEKLPNYHLIISNITIKELDATKNRKRKRKLRSLIQRLDVRVLTSECVALAVEYLKIVTLTKNDASHAAAASVFGCDFLLSWNFKHLVNYGNQQIINGINLIHGYKPIRIISPYEL